MEFPLNEINCPSLMPHGLVLWVPKTARWQVSSCHNGNSMCLLVKGFLPWKRKSQDRGLSRAQDCRNKRQHLAGAWLRGAMEEVARIPFLDSQTSANQLREKQPHGYTIDWEHALQCQGHSPQTAATVPNLDGRRGKIDTFGQHKPLKKRSVAATPKWSMWSMVTVDKPLRVYQQCLRSRIRNRKN